MNNIRLSYKDIEIRQGEDTLKFTGLVYTDALGNSAEDFILRKMRKHQAFFEKGILSRVASMGITGTYLDCGSHLGNHAVFFSNYCKSDKVFAFEPFCYSYKALRANIQRNCPPGKVIASNIALGKESGIGHLSIVNAANLGTNRFVENTDASAIPVYVTSLDIEIPKTEKISFLKIDVEGQEVNLLQGATRLIKRDKPFIWVEVWDESFAQVQQILDAYGYRFLESFRGNNHFFEAK